LDKHDYRKGNARHNGNESGKNIYNHADRGHIGTLC